MMSVQRKKNGKIDTANFDLSKTLVVRPVKLSQLDSSSEVKKTLSENNLATFKKRNLFRVKSGNNSEKEQNFSLQGNKTRNVKKLEENHNGCNKESVTTKSSADEGTSGKLNTNFINNEEPVENKNFHKYKSYYKHKKSKSVTFASDVGVIYFNGCGIIKEMIEALKKDVEQQKCNEKMRKGQLLKSQEKYHLYLF